MEWRLTVHSSRRRFAARLNSGVRPSMTLVHRIAVVFLVGASANACCAQNSIPPCASGLLPVVSVPPTIPAKLHNDFEGSAVISFVVDREGRVQSPAVASSQWHPLGRTRPSSLGHNDAILSAVRQWRYPPQAKSCRHQVPFEFEFDESLIPSADRPNNAFKPTPLRSAKHMAGQACHVLGSTTRRGLT